MTELLSDDVIAKLRAGLKGLPPGPWETDGVRQDDAPDRHSEYELLDARGYRLCDTQNCDYRFGEIEIEYDEDGSSAWNEPARKLMEHIARCDPATIEVLLAERSARQEAEAKLAAAEAEIVRLREAIRWAHDTLYEINLSNYDHDEVCRLNYASVEVILGLAPILGETHGKTKEWWADRAALNPSEKASS